MASGSLGLSLEASCGGDAIAAAAIFSWIATTSSMRGVDWCCMLSLS
jgi:hypothetical protein